MNNLVPKDSRLEIKFITHDFNYPLVINWIKLNKENFKKKYSDRIVNNIYFDSFTISLKTIFMEVVQE